MSSQGDALAVAQVVEAILTENTCAEACWYAREDVCRCSCGGKNHGSLRRPGGDRPARTRRVQGERYELAGIVGYDPDGHGYFAAFERAARDEADRVNDGKAAGRSGLVKRQYGSDVRNRVFYTQATVKQINTWAELEPYQGDRGHWMTRPFLIWRMIT